MEEVKGLGLSWRYLPYPTPPYHLYNPPLGLNFIHAYIPKRNSEFCTLSSQAPCLLRFGCAIRGTTLVVLAAKGFSSKDSRLFAITIFK
ncbi:hypothetical protein Lser_V15G46055 [Lactuca serriola]